MNRFEYLEARLHENESYVCSDRGVKLYDGDEKTKFEDGEVVLTSHRLFWGRPGEVAQAVRTLCLNLHYIVSISEETASSYLFGRKIRLVLHLREPMLQKLPGPLDNSRATHIKLSGKHGLSNEFSNALREVFQARVWEVTMDSMKFITSTNNTRNTVAAKPNGLHTRTGIGGIERVMEAKARETNDNIALAFQDLNVLMGMAKDMIGVARSISTKIREQQGDISQDETVRFKSYLLSLGISDPVTRDSYTSNTEYFRSLAGQITEMLLEPILETGGMMSLADAFCRVNRARGLELLSPEDLLHACQQLDGPLRLRSFPSGAMVVQLETQDDAQIAAETLQAIEVANSLAVEELAQQLGISLLLAKERLLTAERLGKVCRDDSIAGLRFFPNLFLSSSTSPSS